MYNIVCVGDLFVECRVAFVSIKNVSKTVIGTPSLLERAGRSAWLGPPPLLEGEDAAAYDELLGRISGAVKPSDIFEEIWVQDIVDLVWEVVRLRRLSANPTDGHSA